jgi:YVTN family beta-propeller protein
MGPARPSSRARQLLAALPIVVLLIAATPAAAHANRFARPHRAGYIRVIAGRVDEGTSWLRSFDRRGPTLSVNSVFERPPGSAPTVMVGTNPLGDVADPATHTLYVANGGDTTVSVIDIAHCTGVDPSGCGQPVATVNAGPSPFGFALDPLNHTLYVTDAGSDTVAMLDTSTCNATDTAGCGTTPLTTQAGNFPAFPGLDQATDTLYVPNITDGTVSVIDAATCNATTVAGCGQTATVTTGTGATEAAVDDQTHTVFVGNSGNATGGPTPPGTVGTMSMIDTTTCSALDMACSTAPATVPVGPEPSGAVVVDHASDTVYLQDGPTGDGSLGSVAMIDGQTCNATTTAGCAPRFTPDGSGPIWITENQTTRTVYAVNQEDDDISVIDARTCNATDSAGCRLVPPALAIGGPTSAVISVGNDGGAGTVAVDPTTDTLYATSQGENDVSVLNGATCDATDTGGCTPFASTTTIGNGPQGAAADPATNTVYVSNVNDNTVSVIDSRACNAHNQGGCNRAWPTFKVGDYPQDLRVDVATDTIYVVNAGDNTVSVVNGATCNAHDAGGCGQAAATVTVGASPFALAIDHASDTIYVANQADNTVSVIDGATCNGTDTSGCGQTPTAVAVGSGPNGVAVDQRTDTVYVTNGGTDTVSVIDGATCNGTHSNGCGQSPAAVTVGNGPYQIDVDQRTDTVYVDNLADSTMSVIDGDTCNGREPGGCSHPAPAVPVEQLPFGIAVDQRSDAVYVTSIVANDVTTFNGRACTASNIHGCRPEPVPLRMGGWPVSIALDGASSTGYVADNVDGTVSMFALNR